MIDWAAFMDGMGLLTSSAEPWLVVIPGLFIGLLGGALPAISGSMTLALSLPFIMYMDFLPAILFLTAVYTGAAYGGAVPAILVNMPGSTAAVATAFDGFPMAKKGLHNEALGIGLGASAVGDAFGYILLLIFVNYAAAAVLKLGPFEMFLVAIWGLSMIAVLRDDSLFKGLAAGAIGLLIGTIGMGPTGVMRGTMGMGWLLDGIPTVPAMIGLLAMGELYNLASTRFIVEDKAARTISLGRILRGMGMVFQYPAVLLRGSFIGVMIGAIPGVGGSVANLISYGVTKQSVKDGDSMGKGDPRGIIASESSNSSSEGGSLATLLALGIPGGGGTAVILAAFAMHNINGGPRFINDYKDIVYAIIGANLVQALLIIPVGLIFIRLAVYIVRVPLAYVIPSVIVLATFGSFAITNDMSGPVTLFLFSLVGWVFSRFGYSTAAAVVGLLLGRMVEGELSRSYQISGGDIMFLFGRPIALVLLVLLLLSLFGCPLFRTLRHLIGRRNSVSTKA